MPFAYRLVTLIAVSFLFLCHPALLEARTQAPENCVERPFDKGKLWKITRENTPPSYVFGTMHSKDPRILQLPGIIMQAFTRSQTAVFETSLKDENVAESQAFMLLPQDQQLKSSIGSERFAALSNMLAPYGMTPDTLNRVKIWAAAAILSQPPPSRQKNTPQMTMLDKELEKSARQSGKEIIALETNLEQLSLFDKAPLDVQLEYLDQAMAEHDTIEEEMEVMTDYYLRGNTGWIACELEDALKSASAEFTALMTQKLIDERNARMVQRMTPALERGGAFVGVGALHLPGENGILSLLQQQGYSVERKY
ncbi:MAG: TraB/GumN family protein [Proteobacteria bacterium]|nr:TraB/GumN family protein [Pseudomonadota bacterium]